MTNEEAIKELRDASDSEVRYGDTKNHYDKVMKRVEAFDIAIKALMELKNYQKARDEINQEIINWNDIDDGKVRGLFLAESIIAHYVDGGDEE